MPLLCQLLLHPDTSLEVAVAFRPFLATLINAATESIHASLPSSKHDMANVSISLIDLLVFAPYLTR